MDESTNHTWIFDKIMPIMQSPLWMIYWLLTGVSSIKSERVIFTYALPIKSNQVSDEFIRMVFLLMKRSIYSIQVYKDASQRPAYIIPRQSILKLISFHTLGRNLQPSACLLSSTLIILYSTSMWQPHAIGISPPSSSLLPLVAWRPRNVSLYRWTRRE